MLSEPAILVGVPTMSIASPKNQVVTLACFFLGIAALPFLFYVPFLELLGLAYSESPRRDGGLFRTLFFGLHLVPLLLYPLLYVYSVTRCVVFIKKDNFVKAMKVCWIPYKTAGFVLAVVLLQVIFDKLFE